jgi:hypothetical protein
MSVVIKFSKIPLSALAVSNIDYDDVILAQDAGAMK